MNLRITGGELKGRRLRTAPGAATRPSTGRLREALFSSLADRVEGAAVADLFAGSGALGIEALSRGAQHALFVEIERASLSAIADNLRACGLAPPRAVVRRGDARRWLARHREQPPPGHPGPWIVLMDPPYQDEVVGELLPAAAAMLVSGAAACCVLEHDARAPLPDPGARGIRLRTRRHGRGAFTVLEPELRESP